MVPIGASRMIHQSTFCTIDSAARLNARNGSALSPSFSAAMPMAADTTTNCSTLKLRLVAAAPLSGSIDVFAVRARKLVGTRLVRNAHQSPVRPGSAAWSWVTDVCSPGCRIRPSAMPMATAIKAVIANHSSVCPARRAALVTLRRFAMLATIAVKISGMTAARSRSTNSPPTVSRVLVSQFGLPSAAGPSSRATNPRMTPRARPRRTWTENEGSRSRRGAGAPTVAVSDMRRPSGTEDRTG